MRFCLTLSVLVALSVAVFATKSAIHRTSPLDFISGKLQQDILCSECNPNHAVHCTQMMNDFGIEETQKATEVNLLGLKSHSGFFESEKDSKNMFWWYFPSQDGNEEAPVVIWLQGGPGGSSLFGLFTEMGPYLVDANDELQLRDITWNKKYSMLFIDNPVGAGFSHTVDGRYCQDEACVSQNLYNLLQQFYELFPKNLDAPLYISGESYGGHYVPAFAFKVFTENTLGRHPNIPLQGMMIGDGWVDPITQLGGYADMLFGMGLLNVKQREEVRGFTDEAVALLAKGDTYGSFKVWDKFLNGDIFPYPNWFHNATGSNNYDNFMRTDEEADLAYFGNWLAKAENRNTIHVGDTPFASGNECEKNLLNDFMVSLKPELTVLLNAGLKTLIYSGQLDVIIGAALTERYLPTIEWTYQKEFIDAKRSVWRVDDSDASVAGFTSVYENFRYVTIRQAGHMVPHDQPERAMDMIDRFIENKAFANLPEPKQVVVETDADTFEEPVRSFLK